MDSIWSTTSSLRERSRLPGDRETQVAVIGGGMAGILIAHTLQAAGLRSQYWKPGESAAARANIPLPKSPPSTACAMTA